MSDDLVNRLRREAGTLATMYEAATAIERLRTALEGMNDDGCYAACKHYGLKPGQHSAACEAARAALENT